MGADTNWVAMQWDQGIRKNTGAGASDTHGDVIIFRVTGHLCGEFTGHRWIPRTKAGDAEFGVFFDLRLNKQLSKPWLETPLRPL